MRANPSPIDPRHSKIGAGPLERAGLREAADDARDDRL